MSVEYVSLDFGPSASAIGSSRGETKTLSWCVSMPLAGARYPAGQHARCGCM